jgi:hypothetical protein
MVAATKNFRAFPILSHPCRLLTRCVLSILDTNWTREFEVNAALRRELTEWVNTPGAVPKKSQWVGCLWYYRIAHLAAALPNTRNTPKNIHQLQMTFTEGEPLTSYEIEN